MLRRIVPVTIYVDGEYDGLAEVANDLKGEVSRIMGESGYPQVGEWGPFTGSFLSTIFCQGRVAESGQSVLQNLQKLKSRLQILNERIPPEARVGIRVVMLVGELVVLVVGAPAVAAALPVVVPVEVIDYISRVVGAAEIIESVREVLKMKPSNSRRGQAS
jgi:hypothetical protein